MTEGRIRFAAIGLNHGHINGMTDAVLRGGGTLVSFYAPEDDLASGYSNRFPQARRVTDKREILEDEGISLVLSAAIPSDRAGIGLEVLRHGKDYLCDKAAFLNFDDLAEARRVQKETGRIFAISYSERVLDAGAWQAGKLARSGAIGRVLQTTILAPHALRLPTRKPWFFDPKQNGGIITDIGSHQVEQFLYYSGVETAEVVSARVANYTLPDYPQFEDFGEVTLEGKTSDGTVSSGYLRVDWLIPDGAKRTGRQRILLGTEGIIEIQGQTVLLTTSSGSEEINCADKPSDFGALLVDDVLNRTETALPQEHSFYASELTLKAQAIANGR